MDRQDAVRDSTLQRGLRRGLGWFRGPEVSVATSAVQEYAGQTTAGRTQSSDTNPCFRSDSCSYFKNLLYLWGYIAQTLKSCVEGYGKTANETRFLSCQRGCKEVLKDHSSEG